MKRDVTGQLDYASPAPAEKRSGEGRVYLALLRCLAAYFAACTVTLPLINVWWIGELPVFALPQLPKLWIAGFVRVEIVMPLIRRVGLSRGSFSPDYSMARPWGLALAYLVVLGLLVGVVWVRMGITGRYRKWILILLAVAIVDYVMTLMLAGGPGLTLY